MDNYKIVDNEYVVFNINGREGLLDVLIDIEDTELATLYPWHADWRKSLGNYYVSYSKYISIKDGKQKRETIRLHNLIMGSSKDKVVDHINHNSLDNRRCNLRLVDKVKNATNRSGRNSNNTSGYRNVSWIKDYKKWVVQLQVNGTNKLLGKFDDVHEAGEFAKEMRDLYYGNYAGKG